MSGALRQAVRRTSQAADCPSCDDQALSAATARNASEARAMAAPRSTTSFSKNPCAGCAGESAPGVENKNERVVTNVAVASAPPIAAARADTGQAARSAAVTSSDVPIRRETPCSLRNE